MPIAKNACKKIRKEPGTPGGITYHITKRSSNGETPLCFRRLTNGSGNRCANHAGKGTWHVGTGACRKHGGNAGRPPTTGKHAVMAQHRLAGTIQEYMDGDHGELMDLSKELATIRALFAEFMEEFPEPYDDRYGIQLQRATAMIQATGSLVEKISRIEARNTLTASQVLYLRVVMADILMKFVPLEQRQRAVDELLQRFGGGTELLVEG